MCVHESGFDLGLSDSSSGSTGGGLVGVYMGHCTAFVEAFIGINKSGKACIPIDTTWDGSHAAGEAIGSSHASLDSVKAVRSILTRC